MSSQIEVVIVDDAPRTLEKLKRLLEFEGDIRVVGTAKDAETGLEEAKRLNPAVILMDVNLPGLDGIEATEQLSSELPHVPVVIISVQDDREYLKRAMQSGAREYLVKPFSADELVGAIRRVNKLESLKRTKPARAAEPVANGNHAEAPAPPAADAKSADAPAVESAPEEPAEVYPALEERGDAGRLTVVFSAKGGVGKSTLAIGIASAIAKQSGEEVALVDLDLQFGDLAILLGMEPKGSFADIATTFPNVDGFLVGGLMPTVEGGLRVLAAPLSPELADLVTAEHVRTTLELLTSSFSHVVVDTSSHLNDVGLEALERAQRIVLVTNLSISAIKETKLSLKLFDDIHIDRDRIDLVVNQADAPSNVTIEQLETNLGCTTAARIPSQPKVVLQAISKGLPFTHVFPDAEISQRVNELARSLAGARKRAQPSGPSKMRRWL